MIIEKVRQEIARHDKPENKLNYQRFFKEKLKDPYGLKTTIVRKISSQCFKEIKDQPKEQILKYCDELFKSDIPNGKSIAFDWAVRVKDDYRQTDFTRFESWLKNYVNSWASCDSLCCGAMGHLVRQYPQLVSKTKKWTKSKNRWFRRAAAVSLIVPVTDKQLLDEVFKTADLLLVDDDDMVQKGYGWMLKEASNRFPDEVFRYVMKNKKKMPRTALRYAIEKLPQKMRKDAMKKDW